MTIRNLIRFIIIRDLIKLVVIRIMLKCVVIKTSPTRRKVRPSVRIYLKKTFPQLKQCLFCIRHVSLDEFLKQDECAIKHLLGVGVCCIKIKAPNDREYGLGQTLMFENDLLKSECPKSKFCIAND